MRRVLIGVLIGLGILAYTLTTISGEQGLPDTDRDGVVIERQRLGDNERVIIAPAGAEAPADPNITFIQTYTPYCYQPDPKADVCYVNFNSHSVNSSPATYMIAMTVTIDSKIRAMYQGFFQNFIYVSYDMQDAGFKVQCGALNSSGDPAVGKKYQYIVQARDSNNLTSANYGVFSCPAFQP